LLVLPSPAAKLWSSGFHPGRSGADLHAHPSPRTLDRRVGTGRIRLGVERVEVQRR
jgi:hypothetical protein